MAGGVDAAHPGHVQVHDDDVRRELSHGVHRLRARRGLGHHLHALLLEEVPQARAEEIVIVGDQDSKRLRLPLVGGVQLAQLESPPGARGS